MDNEIQARIRSAVSAGDFGDAAALWETYSGQAAQEIRGGMFPQARLARMRELIEWTRSVVACAQAQAQVGINTRRTQLHAAAIYGRPPR
jgi:hypothetical protein